MCSSLRNQVLRLGDDAQPRFGLTHSRMGRGEHAEVPGLIPANAECLAIGRVLAAWRRCLPLWHPAIWCLDDCSGRTLAGAFAPKARKRRGNVPHPNRVRQR
jgi:hypothetical protein